MNAVFSLEGRREADPVILLLSWSHMHMTKRGWPQTFKAMHQLCLADPHTRFGLRLMLSDIGKKG